MRGRLDEKKQSGGLHCMHQDNIQDSTRWDTGGEKKRVTNTFGIMGGWGETTREGVLCGLGSGL